MGWREWSAPPWENMWVLCSTPHCACSSPLSRGFAFCTWASLVPSAPTFCSWRAHQNHSFLGPLPQQSPPSQAWRGTWVGSGARVQNEEKGRPCLVSETLFFPPRQIIACVARGGTQQGGPTSAYGPNSNSTGRASPPWILRKWAVRFYIKWFYTVLPGFLAFADSGVAL